MFVSFEIIHVHKIDISAGYSFTLNWNGFIAEEGRQALASHKS